MALEWKLDGARIQVHKAGDEIKVFSRNLREVTAAVPEVVEAARRLPANEVILDGEVIALRPDGTPETFQRTMQRFGRKLDVDRLRAELPLTPFFFDCLYVDGASLIDQPQAERFADARRDRAVRDRAEPVAADPRRCGALRGGDASPRPRRGHGEGARVRLRRGPPRSALAEGQARAHARSRRPRCRMGPRPPERMAEQPAPGRA